MHRKVAVTIMCAIFFALVLPGCATLRHPVPQDLIYNATICDMDDVRTIIGEEGTMMEQSLLKSIVQEQGTIFPVGPDGIKAYPVLAISGGGANGAYGAGLLKGWSEEGSRPDFKIVTGVSTGAIIAPFAFLGKEYDDELERTYTTMDTKDVMGYKWPFGPVFGNSLATNAPLARTIARIIDKELLAKIAAEHRRGRRLFIGTANLDAQRLVIWDMGAIACKGDCELFRKVVLASAAIPVIFPPSIFHVEASGNAYDELHTDGGTLTQVFTTYKLLEGMRGAAIGLGIDPLKIRSSMYIIRNGYMAPRYKPTKDDFLSLASRSFNTIIDTQGIGDAYRVYVFVKQRGGDYNLAYIPSDFVDDSKQMFDPAAMTKLFDRGYRDAVAGYKWHKAPPGLEAGNEELGE